MPRELCDSLTVAHGAKQVVSAMSRRPEILVKNTQTHRHTHIYIYTYIHTYTQGVALDSVLGSILQNLVLTKLGTGPKIRNPGKSCRKKQILKKTVKNDEKYLCFGGGG